MAKARNWQALSPAYRTRLERKGITRSTYESGFPLSAARGHKRTPERPAQAAKNPAKFSEYVTRKEMSKSDANDARKWTRELRKIANRYAGVDGFPSWDELLAAIPPSERAEYVTTWKIAHAEGKAHGKQFNSYGRQRLDELMDRYPEFDKAIGFYN